MRTKFVPVPPELNINGEDLKVVGAALVSGLYPKLLALDASGGMKTITNQQPVAIVRCLCTSRGLQKSDSNHSTQVPSTLKFTRASLVQIIWHTLPSCIPRDCMPGKRDQWTTRRWRCYVVILQTSRYVMVRCCCCNRGLTSSHGQVSASSFILDRKIKYSLSPKTSIAIKLIREQFYQVMSLRFRGKKLSDNQQRWFELGLKCLAAGLQDEEAAKICVV